MKDSDKTKDQLINELTELRQYLEKSAINITGISCQDNEVDINKNRYQLIAENVPDVIWTVVLSRLDLLGYAEWVAGVRFPRVADYYQRMKNRSSYSLAQVQNKWWKE